MTFDMIILIICLLIKMVNIAMNLIIVN